jgi:transposase-like protein
MPRRGPVMPLEQRTEYVDRVVLDGEDEIVVAHEAGIALQTIRAWVHDWQRRVGMWSTGAAPHRYDDSAPPVPLTQREIDAGCRLEQRPRWSQDARGEWRVVVPESTNKTSGAMQAFLDRLTRAPVADNAKTLAYWTALSLGEREMLGPAWDLYVEAVQHHTEACALRERALKIAVSVIAKGAA